MTLAVAALSARAIVEAARADGLDCVAIDAFGDVDTRRAARRWWPAGRGWLERGALLAALRAARDEAGATQCIAGSGFEGQGDLLAEVAALLPLAGTGAAERARLDDAQAFFGVLDAAGVVHPPVRFDAPPDPAGWLCKRPGAGGLQVQRAAAGDAPGACWQRERPRATTMSATVLADGLRACVLGINRQWTDGDAAHPFRFGGIAGPLPEPGLRAELQAIADTLAPRFVLRGLASIDFLLHDGHAEVLEINARPPASLALYPGALRAHLEACAGRLPAAPAPTGRVRGVACVYARRALRVGEAQAAALAATPGVHDLPHAGTAVGAGEPLCSLSAEGASAEAVMHELGRRREALHTMMETPR